MKEQNDALERALDLMIKEAARQADEELGREFAETEEKIEFSKEHIKKMNRLFAKERRRHNRRRMIKYSRIAACVVLLLVTVSGVSIYKVDAWRNAFLSYIFDPSARSTDFALNSDGTYLHDKYVYIKYIPKNFILTEYNKSKTGINLLFLNGDLTLHIDSDSIDTPITIDTENVTFEETEMHGYKAVYITKSNFNGIVWSDEYQSYRIIGNISKGELFRIAESIEYMTFEK